MMKPPSPPKDVASKDDGSDDEDNSTFSKSDNMDGNHTDSSCSDRGSSSEERDEMAEVQKMTQTHTTWINRWRMAVFALLIATGIAVTVTTYVLLRKEQNADFDLAFGQFSKALADSTVAQQVSIRQALRQLSGTYSAYASASGSKWPMVTLPSWEFHAKLAREQSGLEMINIAMNVKEEERIEYLNYTDTHYQEWVTESHAYNPVYADDFQPVKYKPFVSGVGFEPETVKEEYFTIWTFSPPPVSYMTVNWNVLSNLPFVELARAGRTLRNEVVLTPVLPYAGIDQESHAKLHGDEDEGEPVNHPHTFQWQPVYENAADDESEIVAFLSSAAAWDMALRNLIPEGVSGILAVISNSCGDVFTYEIDGYNCKFLGREDVHDPMYNDDRLDVDLGIHTHPDSRSTPGHCIYRMSIFPTETFEKLYKNNTPEIFAGVVGASFLMIAVSFFIYNHIVDKRNLEVVTSAARSNAVLTSMLPSHVRDRVMQENATGDLSKKRNLKSLLVSGGTDNDADSKPLADLFLETTVLFADIAGFTAWSSTREPTHVFTLLETIYSAFDRAAKTRRIFKVETVGDCYVAVTGLPKPRSDHAVAMCRFARNILIKMQLTTKELEVQLGPDTGELALRVGIHSGPVTAGILRGERSRFQLFGDTMNTCARLESTGTSGRIHLSTTTAELLIKAGKGDWLKPHEEIVYAIGKGEMETYWLQTEPVGSTGTHSMSSSVRGANSSAEENLNASFDSAKARIIQWNVKTLGSLLSKVIAYRGATSKADAECITGKDFMQPEGASFLDEVAEVIPISSNRCSRKQALVDNADSKVPAVIEKQLEEYVMKMASLYPANAFHSFAHASHVLMSVNKLMSRIVAPSDWEEGDNGQSLHDFTYGITSSPLTMFACAFSALIHDVDHTGAPNVQLAKEGHPVAAVYASSPAEQRSLYLAWNLLMSDKFTDLRVAIAPTVKELKYFRQLVINCVMATDIADKEQKEFRNARWDKAFKGDFVEEDLVTDRNRKATIVIEHLIQASDVSHTMQHWHVYRKWNESFFKENWEAYQAGRADRDPSEYWYKGELGFFDFYLIPLAKKLKDCGVFGVSSGEFLDYCVQNRREWETKGQQVVKEMAEKMGKRGATQEYSHQVDV